MSVIDILQTVIAFAAVGVVGLLVQHWIKLPYSLILVCLGFLLSWLLEPLNWDTGIRASNFQPLMMYVLLPVLVFEAAFSLDPKLLKKCLATVLTLATLGIVISTVVTAVVLFYTINHPGFPLIAALITGVVVSATDPVAVVNQLKQIKAPAQLGVLIEGESLFNDATAIVLFAILISIALGQAELSVGGAFIRFFVVFFGGVLIGVVTGWISAKLAGIVELSMPHLTLITLVTAYGSFYLGEHLLHVSGIVAVLSSALTFKTAMNNKVSKYHQELEHSWQSLGFIANVFVFVLVGLVISSDMFTERWLAILYAVLAVFIARVIAVYASLWISKVANKQPIPASYPPIMIWGGLKGAVTIALVLSLPTELPYWWTIQSISFGVVVFSLVVQATTSGWLAGKLKITEAQQR